MLNRNLTSTNSSSFQIIKDVGSNKVLTNKNAIRLIVLIFSMLFSIFVHGNNARAEINSPIFESDGSSLTGWTNDSVIVDNLVGNPRQSYKILGANKNMRRDLGQSFLNTIITFDWNPIDAGADAGFVFANNSGGNGAYKTSLRMRQLATPYKQGLGHIDNGGWLYLGDPSYTGPETTAIFKTANTWYHIKITVSADRIVKWFVNDVEQLSSTTLDAAYTSAKTNENWFGFLGNNLGGINYWDNFKIYTPSSTQSVTYSGGVGSSGTAPMQASLASNETFTVSSGTALSKTGYTFAKWKNEANVEYLPGATFTVGYTADTLTAQWTLNSYSVSYIAGPNGSISGINPQTVDYGANASIVTAVPDSHYHFNAWDDGVLTGARTDLNISGAIIKSASFAIDTLTATYTAGANGSIFGVGIQTINYGDSATSVTAVAASHYHFDSWSDGLKTSSRRDLILSSSLATTATFAIDTFTVTFNANGGSNGSVTSVNYNANALSSAPNATRSSYSLLGWSETTTGTVLTSWTVVADKTLYAIWNPTIYTINYSPESGTVTTGSETFTVLSKPANWQIPTRSSYVFDGWYTSTSYTTLRGLGGAAFTSNDTETVYAKWTQESIAGIPAGDRTFVDSLGSSDITTKTLTIESGSTGASIRVPSNAFAIPTTISVYSLGNSNYAKSKIDATKEFVVNLIVSWVASDGTVPVASPALTMTITNPAIMSGAIVYGLLGNTYTQLGTATADGSVAFSITTDPVITIANPVLNPPAPPAPGGGGGSSSGGGSVSVTTTVVDDSAAIKAAKEKAEAEAKAKAKAKTELDLKAAQERAAAELQAAQDKAEAEINAAQLASDAAALLKSEEEAKLAADRKAAEDAILAASISATKIVPDVSLFAVSASLKLSTYDIAYLKKYLKSLKPKATVTCIGYIYTAKTKVSVATTRAKKQATAVCSIIKKMKPTLITKVVLVSSKKAPKAAVGAKWVAVSYRVDGYKS